MGRLVGWFVGCVCTLLGVIMLIVSGVTVISANVLVGDFDMETEGVLVETHPRYDSDGTMYSGTYEYEVDGVTYSYWNESAEYSPESLVPKRVTIKCVSSYPSNCIVGNPFNIVGIIFSAFGLVFCIVGISIISVLSVTKRKVKV